MPSRGQTITMTFVAWDNTNNVGKTGDAANFTLRWVKDGTSAVPTNVPATEVDATNAPGLYKIVLTGAECTCNFGCLGGKSSTSGISIIPTSVAFEQLPTAAPNADAGLPILSVTGTTLGYIVSAVGGNVGGNVLGSVAGSVGSIAGVTFPTNFGSLSIDTSGNIKIQGSVKKNAALAGFQFYMALASDHVSPATGKSITATRSLNGGAFQACAAAATEIGAGWYTIDLAASDLNGNTVALSFAAPASDTTVLTLVTQP